MLGIKAIMAALRGYQPGKLASNTVHGTFWHFTRLGCQIISIFIIARVLGPHGYGTLTGLGGLAIILGSLSGLGASMLLLQFAARQPDRLSHYWHASLRIVYQSGTALSLIFVTSAPWLLNSHMHMVPVAAIALSEIIFYPLVYVCSAAFHSRERLGWATALPATMAMARLVGGLIFWASNYNTLEAYCIIHFATSGMAAAAAIMITTRQLKPSKLHASYSMKELRLGLGFSSSSITNIAYGEADKLLTIRLLGSSITGTYTIAYRIIHAIALPVLTLLQAIQPRLLNAVQSGNRLAIKHLIKVLLLAIAAYLPVAILLTIAANHYLVAVLGQAFNETSHILLLLIPLLPLFSLRLLMGTLLSSLNKPALRAIFELAALCVLTLACSQLIPAQGIQGTAISVLIAELFLLLCLSISVQRSLKGMHGTIPDNQGARTPKQ